MGTPDARQRPECGLTHAEHAAVWRTWRDDCNACGYAQQDVEQCATGHPDDGVTWCGACGHTTPPPVPAVLAETALRRQP